MNGVAQRSRAGSDRERRGAAFERCDAPFKHILRGVGQAAVDVAGIAQAKTVRRVLSVVEYIRGGSVNRHRARVGRGVGGLLAYVELQGFEMVVL